MSEFNIELGKLKVDALQKFSVFQKLLNSKLETAATEPNFDLLKFIDQLQNSSPEGIDYNLAQEKLNKYRAENEIS